MYKVIFLLFICSISNAAFWNAWKPELNLLKADVAKNADAVIKMNNDLKVELQSEIKVQNEMIAKLEADIKANGAAVVGVGNRIEQVNKTITETIGGDKNTIQTNDTGLMKEIIWTYRVIILALLVQMVGLLKFQSSKDNKLLLEKDKQISAIITSKDRKEEKLDAWQNKMIEGKIILNGKGG